MFFFPCMDKDQFCRIAFPYSCQMCVVPKPGDAEVDCDELKASHLLSMENTLQKKLKTFNYICET